MHCAYPCTLKPQTYTKLVNPDRIPKLGQSDLLYGSKSPIEKVGGIFKPCEPHSTWYA